MAVLALLVLMSSICALCLLAGWICLLRFMRHVHDTSGADAVRPLYRVALAYLRHWRPAASDTTPESVVRQADDSR